MSIAVALTHHTGYRYDRAVALGPRLGRPGDAVVVDGPRLLAATGAPQPPTIITRAEWGADESLVRSRSRTFDPMTKAVVHHTAGSNDYTAAQSAAIVRGIELYHVEGNGWNDIGYNFLVDKYGQVFEGRYGGMERPVVGAHAMGFNTGSVGVAVLASSA